MEKDVVGKFPEGKMDVSEEKLFIFGRPGISRMTRRVSNNTDGMGAREKEEMLKRGVHSIILEP